MFNDPLGNKYFPAVPDWHPASLQPGTPADVQAMQSSFFDSGGGNGSGGSSYYGNTSAMDGGDYSDFWNSNGGNALIDDVMAGLNNSNVNRANVNSVTFSMGDFMTAAAAENNVSYGQTASLLLNTSNGSISLNTSFTIASADKSYMGFARTTLEGSGFAMTSNSLPGGGDGHDPHFVKGQSPATGFAFWSPYSTNYVAGRIAGGWEVSISYTLTKTNNGNTVVNLGTYGASVVGLLANADDFVTKSQAASVNGSIISFTFGGNNNYELKVKGVDEKYSEPTKIWGSYDTSNGNYSIVVQGQFH